MNYRDLDDKEKLRLDQAGLDYDLMACLEYNDVSITLFDIENVIAVWEGQNDGDSWRWIIKVSPECSKKNGGRFAFIEGGCDYTGWD